MALDAFLQFKGEGASAATIEGETLDKIMGKESPKPFDLQNWSFSISQDVNVGSASGGMGAGKVKFEQFAITKQIDKSSPLFFHTCCTGGHYDEVNLLIRKSGGAKDQSGDIYLQFNFKMVFVSNIAWTHADPAPTEAITFDYGALRIKYKPQAK